MRSGIVPAAQDYPWCSAKAHLTGVRDPLLSGHCFLIETVQDWTKYLGEDQDREAAESLIKATKNGRPCGHEEFVKQIEELLDRRLTASPRGRPGKGKKNNRALSLYKVRLENRRSVFSRRRIAMSKKAKAKRQQLRANNERY